MILSGDGQWGGKQEKLTILFSNLCKFFLNFAPILYRVCIIRPQTNILTMKRISILIILVVLVSGCFTSLKASPAFPGLISFSQPDGSKVNIYLRGDEKVHWAESEDGYSLVYDDNGYLCYAIKNANGDMIASEFRATDITARPQVVKTMLMSTQKKLRFSHQQVSDYLAVWDRIAAQANHNSNSKSLTGSRRALVVLFQTPDCQLHHRKSEFLALFNDHNYTEGSAHGSVYDYYHEASNGQFNLQVDVLGPITADHNMAYYGDDDSQGSWEFGTEVAQKIAGLADFSEYDNDGDGVVDGMHIIFAGYGEEAGGGSDRIWSHQWYVWNAPTYDGITFGPYSCSPELRGNFGTNLTRIGVICHELGHVFGAPDYYDTDYEGSGGEYPGLGKWDIMSSGSWNDNGRTPARHGAYTATNIYKWTTATTLTDPQTVTITQAGDRHDVYRINTSTNGDYFIMENRQKKGFDSYLPGHGLLVYHVHSSANGSSVSNSTHPQQLYIVSAIASSDYPEGGSSSYGSIETGATTFPGYNHKDSLTDNSTPWLRPWSGVENHTPLYFIQENFADSSIFFYFKEMLPVVPTQIEAHYISEHTIKVDFEVIGNYPTTILMSPDPTNFYTPDTVYLSGDTLPNGNIVVYDGYRENVAYFTLDTTETPDTLYFKIFCRFNDVNYAEGPYTAAIPYEYFKPYPMSIEANYTSNTYISVAWQPSEPCQMLVLMSTNEQFDTPYGDYTTGSLTRSGNIVFYAGDDTLFKSHHYSPSYTPTTYFKFFCRQFGDNYSEGITAVAISPMAIDTPERQLFAIHPNPARDKVTIEATQIEDAEVVVTDQLGRHISSQKMKGGSTTIDTSRLPRGTYFISVTTQSQRSVSKLILQ